MNEIKETSFPNIDKHGDPDIVFCTIQSGVGPLTIYMERYYCSSPLPKSVSFQYVDSTRSTWNLTTYSPGR